MSHPIEPRHVIRLEPNSVWMLDQRHLPDQAVELGCRSGAAVATAISERAVRGAECVAIGAAMGLALGAVKGEDLTMLESSFMSAQSIGDNVARAMADVKRDGTRAGDLVRGAQRIHTDRVARCRAMSRHAAARFPDEAIVLTTAYTGALTTGGHGTALGAIRTASGLGKLSHVYVDGAGQQAAAGELSSWELSRAGIAHSVIVDDVVAAVRDKGITNVVVGADQIGADGSIVSAVGASALARACGCHHVQFDVVAPTARIAAATTPAVTADARDSGARSVAPGATLLGTIDPVDPGLISAIVTEVGVHESPYPRALADAVLLAVAFQS